MTNVRPSAHDDAFASECIEPELGHEVWRLDDPDCPPGERADLETHLAFCAACRLARAVAARTAEGLASGRLQVKAPAPRRRVTVWLGRGGALALAAALALVILLPPVPEQAGLTVRGAGDPAITAPVPDEVIADGQPLVRWDPVDGANRYRVVVEAVAGDLRREVTTPGTSVRLTGEQALGARGRYRVSVEPIPAVYAPPAGLHSSFRVAGRGAWLAYRATHGPAGARLLGAVGLLLLATALARSVAAGALSRRGA